MTMADIDPEADKQQYKKKYWIWLVPERAETINTKHHRKDEQSYPVEVRMGLLELGGEKLIMALARDITERLESENKRLQLEGQLQQAQKMESIGTLAGGIAHDFNNILTPISGYVELALMKTTLDPETVQDLTEVRKATERAKDMVKQILTFSRRDSDNLSPLEMQSVVKEALKLLRASIPTTIEIRQNINPDCGLVLANPTMIHQVLMNLCTNAYQAMQDTGGVLGVSLLPLEISAKDFIQNLNLKPGSYLRLEVSDTGHGIDQATREKIFEPYFTTKSKGEGTGMGLSVVHGVIKGLGGHITVYSEPGEGTTFHIYLPVIESVYSKKEDVFKSTVPRGTEKVMIVDDEESVRKVEKDILERLGYDIEVFACPQEALDNFTTQPELYDLIITDMTMPKMTGDQLAKKILEIKPDMPVILCTGFSNLINEENAKDIGIKKYLSKPVIMQSFGWAVRNVLDGLEE